MATGFTQRSFGVHLFAYYQVCFTVLSWKVVSCTNTSTTYTIHTTHSHTKDHTEPHGASTTMDPNPHDHHTPTISSDVTTPNFTRIELTLPPTMSTLEMKQKLEDLRVVPDVIPIAPEQKIDVWFGIHCAQMGNIIHEDVVAKQPVILLWRWNPGEYFTLIVTGPDVPNSKLPTDAEWRHWIVMNIPGNDVTKGLTIRDYIGFGNETEIGLHRMVFVVFKQPRPYMKSPELPLRFSTSAYRGFFSTRNFARMHGLGDLVAANFVIVNCTNIIHDPIAWAAMTTQQTKTETRKPTTEEITTHQGYEWTAIADEVTEAKKPTTGVMTTHHGRESTAVAEAITEDKKSN